MCRSRICWSALSAAVSAAAVPSICHAADETGVHTIALFGAAGVAAATFDVVFTAMDISHLADGSAPAPVVGFIEAFGAAPQVAVATYVMLNPPPFRGARPLVAGWGLWALALTTHGVWRASAIRTGTPVLSMTAAPGLVSWSVIGRF